MINNKMFLQAIFGDKYEQAHVTSFNDDPSDIGQDRRGICWAGHAFGDKELTGLNQYFTVSLFSSSKRRKADFEATYVIVLDDVEEKLSLDQAKKLPEPSCILETSHGSKQWFYFLATPNDNMDQICNLLDGLIASDLAPNSKDPGMSGVTRYMRLPEGKNNKASKLVFGQPFNCKILLWRPSNRYTLEDIAAPFNIDLFKVRKQVTLSGASDIEGHPLLNHVTVNEVLSPGRYDILCPWVDTHSNADNSGTAIFTNADGSMGFKCHHGHCQDKNARSVLQHYDIVEEVAVWQVMDLLELPEGKKPDGITDLIATLDHMVHGKERNAFSLTVLEVSNKLGTVDRLSAQKKVREIMGWSKKDLNDVMRDNETKEEKEFFDNYVFVGEQNKFYNSEKYMWFTPEAFTNFHLGDDAESRTVALKGRTKKVDKIDYAPEFPDFFTENGVNYGNLWRNRPIVRKKGDCSTWLEHFKTLGWDSKHMLQWMAFTIRHPGQKINHTIILGSGEGSGKDWLLTPLKKAMDMDHRTISGEDLLKDFNTYLVGTKYLHINEVELGGSADALKVSNRIKPLTCAPPETLPINEKSIKGYDVRNIVNVTMTTNSRLPLRLRDMSRRIYALWSDFSVRDDTGNVSPKWAAYWDKQWAWMNGEGWKHCVDYLMELDISDFNPGESPPVTEWLSEMVGNSENGVVQTLRCLFANRYLNLSCNEVTTMDILSAFTLAKRTNPELTFCDRMTPSTVDLNMKNMGYRLKDTLWQIRKDGGSTKNNIHLVK
jgi:hypothetical protein